MVHTYLRNTWYIHSFVYIHIYTCIYMKTYSTYMHRYIASLIHTFLIKLLFVHTYVRHQTNARPPTTISDPAARWFYAISEMNWRPWPSRSRYAGWLRVGAGAKAERSPRGFPDTYTWWYRRTSKQDKTLIQRTSIQILHILHFINYVCFHFFSDGKKITAVV